MIRIKFILWIAIALGLH